MPEEKENGAKKVKKNEVLTFRITKQEKELLNEMKELLYKNGTIKRESLSETLRYLVFSRTRQIVLGLKTDGD